MLYKIFRLPQGALNRRYRHWPEQESFQAHEAHGTRPAQPDVSVRAYLYITRQWAQRALNFFQKVCDADCNFNPFDTVVNTHPHCFSFLLREPTSQMFF